MAVLDRPYTLVYRSLRQRSRDGRWPAPEDPLPDDVMAMTWALVCCDVDDGVRVNLRLRLRTTRRWTIPFAAVLGGLVDEITVRVLFAGLRERLRS